MATLRELEAEFLQLTADTSVFRPVQDLAHAQGLMFLCPKCFAAHNGRIGTHYVICWFRGHGVPDELDPKPGRWTPAGTSLDDLTFVGPGQFSVQLNGGCNWHGYIRDGQGTLS